MKYLFIRLFFPVTVLLLCNCSSRGSHRPAIPSYSVYKTAEAPAGYYFLQAAKVTGAGPAQELPCLMVLDGNGDLVLAKPLGPGEWAGDFKIHSNRQISYNNDTRKKTYIMNPDFRLIDSVAPGEGYKYDFHEFHILPNGNYVLLANYYAESGLGGFAPYRRIRPSAPSRINATCWAVQEYAPDKKLVYEWRSDQHYQLGDMDTLYLSANDSDIVHFNSIDYQKDYFIVSARNYNEITKVDKQTGQVVWRLGGKRNEFKLEGDSGLFVAQHMPRLQNGRLTLLDNGREKPFRPTFAREYNIDENKKTVKLEWSCLLNQNAYSLGYGNVQKLQDNKYLVANGKGLKHLQMFSVIDSGGKKVFEISFADTLKSYRVYHYDDLPGAPEQPKVQVTRKGNAWELRAPDSYREWHWSDGKTGQHRQVEQAGTYQLYVPLDEGWYLASKPVVLK